ncbi:MAG: outer membrane lipoprotein-sorting protein [Gammaproteobacteria bacterium]|jgi:hypothetical protein|nr:outer membrane lipoprotein-sorting protein [Gammaproteobacteria bacterium]
MRPLFKRIVLCLLLGVGVAGVAAQADERGATLARQVYDRPDGADLTAAGMMELTEAGREPRIRRFVSFRLDRGRGETRSLIRFIEPADIRGTGLLTIDRTGRDADQWVYLPALDRSRRIPAARKGGRFVASDLYYEDMQDRAPDEDVHRWLREDSVGGNTVEVLESVPVDAGNSVYSKRISWIDPATLLPLRVDYFRRGSGEPFKRLTVQKVERIQDYWTVTDSVMEDLETRHRTRMVIERAIYDRDLPQDLFSEQVLEDAAREERYRP